MKSSFFKRLGAFLIDYLIVSFILSLITMSFSIDTSKYEKELNTAVNNYVNGEITVTDYVNQVNDINYALQKVNLPVNIVSISLTIGYFVIFAYLNKGQTLGKKLLKLRVVSIDDEKVSFISMLVRNLFIYGIVSGLFNVIFISFLGKNTFNSIYSVMGNIEGALLLISVLMVLYRKDRRGLHDIVARTKVIEEKR